ncbi:MAG: universal stress protein [Nitrospiraceae bacterium]|nr:universal stress protein [Nitrospiraceae bacterium]
MRKQLLFVTYQNEEMDDGLGYAVDLAQTMNEGITVLLVKKDKLMKKFEDMMTAAAFAEEGLHETARQIYPGHSGGDKQTAKNLESIKDKCREVGVQVNIHSVTKDTFSAVKDFLRQSSGIDMILLSPSVTGDGNLSGRDLQRLVRTASRPVVTMSRQAIVAA